MLTIDGLEDLERELDGLDPEKPLDRNLFVETLACNGGCIHGPAMSENRQHLRSRLTVLQETNFPQTIPDRSRGMNIDLSVSGDIIPTYKSDSLEIKKAMLAVGKQTDADELNCGGCGYNSCYNFAEAMVQGKAEPAMCVSYMRKLASQKANALIHSIPLGVIIVSAELRILECNDVFLSIISTDRNLAGLTASDLKDQSVQLLRPLDQVFISLKEEEDMGRKPHFHWREKLLDIHPFVIEKGQVMGLVLRDVTATEMKREEIAEQARTVISKNLNTVQEIACKLGEHMAETEILLRDIAMDYSDTK